MPPKQVCFSLNLNGWWIPFQWHILKPLLLKPCYVAYKYTFIKIQCKIPEIEGPNTWSTAAAKKDVGKNCFLLNSSYEHSY